MHNQFYGSPFHGFQNLVFCITENIHETEVLLTLVEKNLLQISDITCNLPKTGEVIIITLRDKKFNCISYKTIYGY